MKLVFIHGRDQQTKIPDDLKLTWKLSLLRGLKNIGLRIPDEVDICFPFYGDALVQLIAELDKPLLTDVVMKGAPLIDDEVSFQSEILYDIVVNSGISDAEIQSFYTRLPREKGPLNWEWVHAILMALDKTPLGAGTISRFTRDVYVYLTYKAVRNAIDEIVTEAFTTDGLYVVVGHSLGSIVGYNVLTKLALSKIIVSYITVGSPLGIRAIKKQLDSPLATPACVKNWYNAMDDRDVVALYPLNEKTFPIIPLIINKTNVDNHTANRHGIEGYLDDPDVARVIYEALNMSNK